MVSQLDCQGDVKRKRIVNVNGRIKNVPAQMHDKDVLLVSGASQNAINFVLKKGYEDVLSLVREVTNNERYSHIK